jgi:hypothetical protein
MLNHGNDQLHCLNQYILIRTIRIFVRTLQHSEADNSFRSAETQGTKDGAPMALLSPDETRGLRMGYG